MGRGSNKRDKQAAISHGLQSFPGGTKTWNTTHLTSIPQYPESRLAWALGGKGSVWTRCCCCQVPWLCRWKDGDVG
eukprot:scaffold6987_cov21-Tisochrysis_lutea.AAC.3